MLPKNDGSASVDTKNKRKMKQVIEEPAVTPQQPTNIFSLPTQQPPTNIFSLPQSSGLQFQFNSQQQARPTEPENLDRFMPRPFTSFTGLLTDEEVDNDLPLPLRHMYHKIDQMTRINGGKLRSVTLEVCRRNYDNLISTGNQEAMKKLMEKEEELSQMKRKILELEQRIGQLNHECQHFQTRVRDLELKTTVQDMTLRYYAVGANREDYADHDSETEQEEDTESSEDNTDHSETDQQEDTKSSLVDQNRVQPGNLGSCRVCFNAQVVAIICPCRHLCLCASCAADVNVCPVCQTPKLRIDEMVLP